MFVLGAIKGEANDQNAAAAILGHAVNQDGRSSSLTAPNGPSQQALYREAHGNAQSRPDSFGCISLHGTGTSLGDPIEVGAVATVFASSNDIPLAFVADKSGLGHAEPAAGFVSLLNGISSTLSWKATPLVHLRLLNPHVQHIADAKGFGARQLELPKQIAPTLDLVGEGVTGSSGFAFQVSKDWQICMYLLFEFETYSWLILS